MNKIIAILIIAFYISCKEEKQNDIAEKAKAPVEQVNVFLGTSADHGQLSPAASSPFNMMSIGPQTNPHIHTGYDHYAKEFDGFTHTRIEGVGCTGSGGNVLIKPILGEDKHTPLIKKVEDAHPGFYRVSFENGIQAEMAVKTNFGIEKYSFPNRKSSLFIDLSYAFANRFVSETHQINENKISGYIDTKTTCGVGIYRFYYALEISNLAQLKTLGEHRFIAVRKDSSSSMQVRIGFSSVNADYAFQKLENITIEELQKNTYQDWNDLLKQITVTGEGDRENLFYSLLYRGLQAPYRISEKDGAYRAIDGSLQTSAFPVYNGWAIWDNYREQLPMLSLFYPERFDPIVKSIANLYPYGKKNWATKNEPSPTVRTEHALVVLLDAYNKHYRFDLKAIKDSLVAEAERLDYSSPDKALESSYDNWAISELLKKLEDSLKSDTYAKKALEYKIHWGKDFADLSKDDVDQMQARGLYQGTIWQYRWFVPYDIEGLKKLTGGENAFIDQLNQFFTENNYNHANQPDLQVPGLYNATKQPWKSQKLFRNIMLDTVVQNYFNDNSKGVDPYIGRIYKNKPRAYIRTMDDNAGTMSSWFVMRSVGLSPANIGDPVYYLTTPIFKSVKINWKNGNVLEIEVINYNKDHFYVQSAQLNEKELNRNWLTHDELTEGGKLKIKTGNKPNHQWGVENQWISSFK